MIDFFLGLGVGAALALFLKGHPKAVSELATLEMRIKKMLIDALNELKAAADADKAKAVAEAEAKAAEAAGAQAAADEQAVRDFTAQNFPPA